MTIMTAAAVPVASAEVALMREAAAAFAERLVGRGRSQYSWPQGSTHRIDDRADGFGVLDGPGRGDRTAPAREHVARLTGTLWEAVTFSGGTRTSGWQHFPAAVGPSLLSSLTVPSSGSLPPGQPAMLVTAEHGTAERHAGTASLQAAYRQRHRTRVLEDIGCGGTGWAGAVASWLTRLSGGAPVTAAVYESECGDETFGPHRDGWLGVVVQAHGAKTWRIGEGVLDPGAPEAAQVITRPGDVLLLPRAMPHDVSTPADPGHSVHVAFAVDRAV